MNKRIVVLEELQGEMSNDLETQAKKINYALTIPSYDQVYFTNYGMWDGESENITASGLTIESFDVNEEGMYTYQGDVVIATANLTRLDIPLER